MEWERLHLDDLCRTLALTMPAGIGWTPSALCPRDAGRAGCGTLLTQWTDRRCALATAFPIPYVENPSSRAVLGDVAKLIN